MLTSYQKGYKRELDFIRKLRESGKFHTVFRSAGSRSPFDIVAISKSKILLVQVKSSRKGLKKQIKKLKKLKVPSCAKKQLWIFGKGWKMLFNS